MECHFYFQTTFWFFPNIYGGKGGYGILTQKTCHGFVVKKIQVFSLAALSYF